MKKTFLILSLLTASLSSVSAATLIADNYSSGIVKTDNTALATGRIRFGIFTVTNAEVSANANDVTYLNNNFREVVNYSGAISAFGLNGFFDGDTLGGSKTYAGGTTKYDNTGATVAIGGTTYDLSGSGSTANVANDIAGSNIYMWVLDNAVIGSATQHGIFVNNANVWTDTDTVPVNDSFFDMAASNITALVGTVNGGPDIGAEASSHKLATIGAIPEPSRALLMFLGLGGFFFRRRRA